MSSVSGITHIAAMMEPSLLRLLRRMGIEFHPMGGLVEHHGVRQPAWAIVAHLIERAKECHRELWEVATDAGRQVACACAPLGDASRVVAVGREYRKQYAPREQAHPRPHRQEP